MKLTLEDINSWVEEMSAKPFKLTPENIDSWAKEIGADKEPRTILTEEFAKLYKTLRGCIDATIAADTRHLTESNKWDIHHAMMQVVGSYHLAPYLADRNNDPDIIRVVAMAWLGAFFTGMRCVLPLSAKKYWDIRQQGGGGTTTGKLTRKARTPILDWLRGEIARLRAAPDGAKLSAAAIVRDIDERRKKIHAGVPWVLPWVAGSRRFISTVKALMDEADGPRREEADPPGQGLESVRALLSEHTPTTDRTFSF